MTVYDRIKILEPEDRHRFLGWYNITKSVAERYRADKPRIYEAMLYAYNLFFDPKKIDELHRQLRLPGICAEEDQNGT